MNITRSLLYLFPNANPTADFIVQDDGDGPYIAVWNLTAPQPTESALAAAWEIIKDNLPPKTPEQKEIDKLKAEKEQLNLSVIELWENIIPLLP